MNLISPKNTFSGFTKRVLVVCVMLISLAACSGADRLQYRDLPVEQLYTEAQKYVDYGQYRFSAVAFDEVERQHPYSVWARRAQLMSAYSYYMAGSYQDAILSSQRYIALHPGNKNAPYAKYLIALSYYEQIADVRRDQNNTEQALLIFNEIVRLHPETEYAKDAREKISLASDHLSGKEMEIGRFYQTTEEYFAAIGRFNKVVVTFGITSHVPEALHRITESYIALGIISQAKKSAAVLAYNYPQSEWNRYSRELIAEYGN
ncbi:MAG: outer membrane protein assembly factor BamD [Kordiimonadaceae bacterium]|jgi:outer membrane protein assembly factor BamD|nr:outer membrane protein assembly factor BamD [Kordiimonadaceae bacterium]MBT6033611.1 outer membrane protein assembly factor BamD [Kordiimonadaceae bacterium]